MARIGEALRLKPPSVVIRVFWLIAGIEVLAGLVDEREAIGTMGRVDAEDVSPERGAQRRRCGRTRGARVHALIAAADE